MRYLFENFGNFDITTPNLNLIFGDSLDPSVRPSTLWFFENAYDIASSCDTLVLEITSRKVVYSRSAPNIPHNHYYYHYYNGKHGNTYILSEEEQEEDIRVICSLAKERFGIERVVIIPHLNLPVRQTGFKNPTRNELVEMLHRIAERLNLEIIDMGKVYLDADPSFCMEDIMPDWAHYRRDISKSGKGEHTKFLKAYFT